MSMLTLLITGSTDGIGKESARQLAARGSRVIIHGRDRRRVETTIREIRSSTGNAEVEGIVADFSTLEGVRGCAAEFLRRWDRLDVLINNAGVFTTERVVTHDGFELTFAVNHLAPFLLTNLLLDLVRRSAPARIITVSSMVHAQGWIAFDDLSGERRFSGYGAYAQSKLANVLFTYELSERLSGSSVTANCLHPGVIGTKLLRAGFSIRGGSPAEGAETIVYLATSRDIDTVTGKYFQNKRITESSAATHDAALRRRLWDASASLSGLPD